MLALTASLGASLGAAGCDGGGLAAVPPYLAASAETIDFGDQVIDTTEERTVYLVNKGSTALVLQPPTGDGGGGVFAVVLDAFSVAPNKDVVARIEFTPTDVTTYTATITVPNGSSNQPELKLFLKGKGVRPDPCQNVTCREPPAPICISSATTRRYEPLGTCNAGRCEHAYHDEDCQYGCDDATGTCRGDPCLGMACTTPPSSCYLANGTCENGACHFTVNNAGQCDDGQACTTGDHCSEGTCVGTPTTCTTPPDPVCVDANTRRTWTAQGAACNPANGGCDYPTQDQFCEFGCTPQGCAGDPCAGITCTTPPNGQCYQPNGTCMAGQCVYTPRAGSCDDGDPCTTGDSCNNGTCGGAPMVCNTPPTPDCASGSDRRVYNAVGTCVAGQCQYGSSVASCDDHNACTTGDSCVNGACQALGSLGCDDGNPCTADSCDAVRGCVFSNTSGTACTTFSAECPTGTCSAGQCVPTPNVTCTATYQADLCQDATVAGVCSASGECVPTSVPPAFTCPNCNGICLQCYIIRICIPFGP